MSDLETFTPAPRIVALNNGQGVEIHPLRLGQMAAFTKAVQPIAGHLMVADYFTVLEQQPEAAIETLVAYGFKPEQVRRFEQDEAVRLLSAIYGVNGDFFIQRLRPAMTQAATGAGTMIQKMKELSGALTGEPSSPGSPSMEPTSPPA